MLENLKPEKVFGFFEEISAIPHGSGNIGKIADYCMSFAEKRGLKAVRESCGNVIIYKDGTSGYEQSQPVILQGHLDMVCEKREDVHKDMDIDGIDLIIDGDWLTADGTTLGGDNGIAVAYILALLDSDDIPHPPVEALLTADEETGMTGAEELDGALLKGKMLINIDSEEEGFITVSCAGGVRADVTYPIEYVNSETGECALEISVEGLLGGHSGVEIHKHRLNGYMVLGSALSFILKENEIFIASLKGGDKTNVIPKSAKAVIVTKTESKEAVRSAIKEYEKLMKAEFGSFEGGLKINAVDAALPEKRFVKKSTNAAVFVLENSPNGVVNVMKDNPDMVISSLNMGTLAVTNNSLEIGYLIRSNSLSGKRLVADKLRSFTEFSGGTIVFDSDYPSWEYRENSPLRDTMAEIFEEIYGRKPIITSIHAGLECALLSDKLPDTDMVSIGPDMENVHTPDERLSIPSVERTWNYLLSVLKALK